MASIPSDALVVDDATVALIESAGTDFKVVSVRLDQVNVTDDALETIIVGSFTLVSHGGLYEVHVPWSREWDVELGATMQLLTEQIGQLYEYPVEV